jgi:hypothetical protein
MIQRFAGILAHQLMGMANKVETCNGSKFLVESNSGFIVSVSKTSQDLSSRTLTSSFPITAGKNVIRSGIDANGLLHYLIKYDVMTEP